jgi:hypothetical protein
MVATLPLLLFEGGGVGDPVEEALEEGVGVTDALEGPRIEPGPSSGESMENPELDP